MNKFIELGLPKDITDALTEMGIETPTPIQEQTLPILIDSEVDLIGLAQTGTGKTAAFGLPLLTKIDTDLPYTQAVVIAPTRELCQQITDQITLFSQYVANLGILAVYGGTDMRGQLRDLKKTRHIIVATPGRLKDLINRKAVKLDKTEYVVLDEADEMLRSGFKEEIDEILTYLPESKTTWLFSATMPDEIKNLVKKFMPDAVKVSVNTKKEVNENIEHQFISVKGSDKFPTLKKILDGNQDLRGIVFCRTRINVQKLAEQLQAAHYPVEALHGEMTQNQRDKVMRQFKEHRLRVLVATDVAARGIDVQDLTHVIHYSLPDDLAYYTHRSGRTARAGKQGISLALVDNRDKRRMSSVQKNLKVKLKQVDPPSEQEIVAGAVRRWARGVVETPVGNEWKELIQPILEEEFAGLSPDDIVERLISSELNKLPYRLRNSSKDSSRRDRDRDRDSDSPRREFGSNKHWDRFFINVGTIDKIRKRDLLDFVCDVTGLEKKAIGDITLKKKISFFDVSRDQSKIVARRFKGVVANGRSIRVNREDSGGRG
ncbi:DEAD/DEAH box helicase [bacterium SCSIO 12741]|nr:DEAD/DEAH box helicase [bacterium SCSIO 12741]